MEEPTEIDLDIISKKVIGQWRSLLIHLGVPMDRIELLREEFHRPVDACFYCLIFWLQGNTSKPVTWAFLCKALEAAERKDCISYREEQMQESSRECPPILNAKPSLQELEGIEKEVNGDYRSFLTHLGVPATKIRSLYLKFRGNIEKVCLEGMVYWIEGNKPCEPPTWAVLLEALEKGAERKVFAENKRDEFLFKVLADAIVTYIRAVKNLIQHRDKGIVYFREAAGEIDRAFKHVAAAKITGSGLGIAGGILGIVGGGLLLGGVTAPAGIPLVAIGTAVGVSGAITGVGATIGNVAGKRKAEKKANKWLHTGRDLCKDVIKSYKMYHDHLEQICQFYQTSEKDSIRLSIMKKGLNVDTCIFQDADDKAKSIITEWTEALEVGSEGVAAAVVSGARVGGEFVRGVFSQGGVISRVAGQGGVISRVAGQGGVISRIAGQGGTVTRVAGQSGTVTRGVAAGAETGAAVARVAVQAAGGVVICLSSAFIVVDLALICKTAYDLNKNKHGTKLGKRLREAADCIDKETETLTCFAHCNQC